MAFLMYLILTLENKTLACVYFLYVAGKLQVQTDRTCVNMNCKYFRALKSHALSVSLIHFDTISRSHADSSISHALALS